MGSYHFPHFWLREHILPNPTHCLFPGFLKVSYLSPFVFCNFFIDTRSYPLSGPFSCSKPQFLRTESLIKNHFCLKPCETEY
ncbi:hypothetical protein ACRRTK_019751 [Alexandromys fortis]